MKELIELISNLPSLHKASLITFIWFFVVIAASLLFGTNGFAVAVFGPVIFGLVTVLVYMFIEDM